jgi:hypothetical protein
MPRPRHRPHPQQVQAWTCARAFWSDYPAKVNAQDAGQIADHTTALAKLMAHAVVAGRAPLASSAAVHCGAAKCAPDLPLDPLHSSHPDAPAVRREAEEDWGR